MATTGLRPTFRPSPWATNGLRPFGKTCLGRLWDFGKMAGDRHWRLVAPQKKHWSPGIRECICEKGGWGGASLEWQLDNYIAVECIQRFNELRTIFYLDINIRNLGSPRLGGIPGDGVFWAVVHLQCSGILIHVWMLVCEKSTCELCAIVLPLGCL